MPTFDQLYAKIRLDLELTAEDFKGQVPVTELRRIVLERVGINPKTYENTKEALILMGKIKPLNQHAFLFMDGRDAGTETRAPKEARA